MATTAHLRSLCRSACALLWGVCLLAAATGLRAQNSIDFNKNGVADVLCRNLRTGSVGLLHPTGRYDGQTFQLTEIFPFLSFTGISQEWQIVGPAKLDGGSVPSILWRNVVTGDLARLSMGDQVFGEIIYYGVSLDWQVVGVGDFNGDGRTDILWRNREYGDVAIWLMQGATLLNPNDSIVYLGVPYEWEVAGVGDTDGDGKADIIWRNTRTGDVALWQMNGTAIVNGRVISPSVSLDMQIAGVADFTRDGKADILWRNMHTGRISFWLMNGMNIAKETVVSDNAPLEWQIVGIGDFDGNSSPDIMFYNGMTGDVSVWYMYNDGIGWGRQVLNSMPLEWQIVTSSRKAFGLNLNVAPGQRADPLITRLAAYTDWVRVFGAVDNSTLLLSDAPLAAHQHGLKAAVTANLNGDTTNNSQQISGLVTLAQQGNVDLAVVGSWNLSRGDLTEAQLLAYINDFRQRAPSGTKITYVDSWDQIVAHPNLIAACDIVGVNIYPFYENATIETALSNLQSDYQASVNAAGGKPVWVMETGWPSEGVASPASLLAQPSQESAAKYFYDAEQWARSARVPLFYCNAYDDPVGTTHGGYASWGVWDVFGTWKSGMSVPFQ